MARALERVRARVRALDLRCCDSQHRSDPERSVAVVRMPVSPCMPGNALIHDRLSVMKAPGAEDFSASSTQAPSRGLPLPLATPPVPSSPFRASLSHFLQNTNREAGLLHTFLRLQPTPQTSNLAAMLSALISLLPVLALMAPSVSAPNHTIEVRPKPPLVFRSARARASPLATDRGSSLACFTTGRRLCWTRLQSCQHHRRHWRSVVVVAPSVFHRSSQRRSGAGVVVRPPLSLHRPATQTPSISGGSLGVGCSLLSS